MEGYGSRDRQSYFMVISPNFQQLNTAKVYFLYSMSIRDRLRILFRASSLRDPGWWSSHSLEHSLSGQWAHTFKYSGNIWPTTGAAIPQEMPCWGPCSIKYPSSSCLPHACQGHVSCPNGDFSLLIWSSAKCFQYFCFILPRTSRRLFGCDEEGEVSAQFASLPKSEKCILCLLHWEHVVL